MEHEPVLLKLVQKYCSFKTHFDKNDCIIDCTLGLGGHAKTLIKEVMKGKGTYIAFEQDQRNLEKAKENLKEFDNVAYIHSNFAFLKEKVEELKQENPELKIQCILYDLGLSSPHIDDAERGFSFQQPGPLDMRFDTSSKALTAGEIIEQYSEDRLTALFKEYGEERFSKRIASAIKKQLPINDTAALAQIIRDAAPYRKGVERLRAAARIFQALRIEVNNELEVLKVTLIQALELLEPQGRIIVISYHSLEDRIVKHFFKTASKDCLCPPEILICECHHKKELEILTKKPIIPTDEEIEENPRSRSAKMRVVQKLKQ